MKYHIIKKMLPAVAGTIVILFSSLPVSAESVFLKDGQIVSGTIVTESSNSLTLRTNENKTMQIPRSTVMRVVYTEIKFGKIFIQTRDGNKIIAHMVDEDRESYTFRYDLYKPVEFKLKRSEVLFIVDKNPAGLKQEGEPDTNSVSIKWQPPYDEVKEYRIYAKKKKEDKFELLDKSSGISTTLKKLSSNTQYIIRVTAVDKFDNESEPSNEITFKTKNLPPDQPDGIVADIKSVKASFKWDAAKDPDGTIKNYNIYDRNDESKVIATVKDPQYIVPENMSIYDLEISAVDDLGFESERVRVLLPFLYVLSVTPVLFMPSDKLGEIFPPGYGAQLNFGMRNVLFMNFEGGINAGCVTFKGKEEENTDSLIMIPVTLYSGYHIRLGDWFTIFPFIKAGMAYSIVKYTGFAGDQTETIIDPLAAGGLSITLNTESFTFALGGDYGILYESSGIKPFSELFLSCGLLF